MIDYYSLLADAVAKLEDPNNPKRRRELYDRGRKLLLTRLRGTDPLDPTILDREMKSFRDACSRAEANFAGHVDLPKVPPAASGRRSGSILAKVVIAIAVLGTVGAGVYWQSRPRGDASTGLPALAELYSVATPALAMVPGVSECLGQMFASLVDAADSRNTRALTLLKAGKPADAEPLLKAVAEDQAKQPDKDADGAATAYLNLALVAAISNSGRAQTYLTEAIRLNPANIEATMLYGWYQLQAGQLDAAQSAFAHVVALARPDRDDAFLISAQLGAGAIEQQHGDLTAAFATYQSCQTIAERLAKSKPGIDDWQRKLGNSYVSLANDYRKAQQLTKAREALSAGRSFVVSLVAQFPDDTQLQQAVPWYDKQIAALNN